MHGIQLQVIFGTGTGRIPVLLADSMPLFGDLSYRKSILFFQTSNPDIVLPYDRLGLSFLPVSFPSLRTHAQCPTLTCWDC